MLAFELGSTSVPRAGTDLYAARMIGRGKTLFEETENRLGGADEYASTGGWGYSQFDDGKPLTDGAMLQNCFDCHKAFKDHDYVFTHYAP